MNKPVKSARTERRMPDPWFRANTYNSPICEMYDRGRHARELLQGERRIGGFILPPFQRPPVWSLQQKVRLIESIWGGLPIGAYVHNQLIGSLYDGWLLDGQQRITAILEYVAGAFPVHRWHYPDLPRSEQLGFELTPVAQLQTTLSTLDECYEVYTRLAYGGTPHTGQEPGV